VSKVIFKLTIFRITIVLMLDIKTVYIQDLNILCFENYICIYTKIK
jgi:hypothetical protein